MCLCLVFCCTLPAFQCLHPKVPGEGGIRYFQFQGPLRSRSVGSYGNCRLINGRVAEGKQNKNTVFLAILPCYGTFKNYNPLNLALKTRQKTEISFRMILNFPRELGNKLGNSMKFTFSWSGTQHSLSYLLQGLQGSNCILSIFGREITHVSPVTLHKCYIWKACRRCWTLNKDKCWIKCPQSMFSKEIFWDFSFSYSPRNVRHLAKLFPSVLYSPFALTVTTMA